MSKAHGGPPRGRLGAGGAATGHPRAMGVANALRKCCKRAAAGAEQVWQRCGKAATVAANKGLHNG
eukprot:15466426-Alexandrium_andersonii.AAC.1